MDQSDCTARTNPYLSVAHASQSWNHVPDIDTTSTAELPQCQLHEVERPAHKEEDDDVGDQEGSSAVLVGREGEPPDVTKAWKARKLSNFGPRMELDMTVDFVHCGVISVGRGYCEAPNFSPS